MTQDVLIPALSKDQLVWARAPLENTWIKVAVINQNGVYVVCADKLGKPLHFDLRKHEVYPSNESSSGDMSALEHLNEPSILDNLGRRSFEDQPYTFMSNVLVAVNPLKLVADGKIKKWDIFKPHPFSVAKIAFNSMSFRFRNREQDTVVSQSIVTTGESGAGKTFTCRKVLYHLVRDPRLLKGDASGVDDLDDRLLESNYITEAFGNAKTLRNSNSSRFGKLLRLNYFPHPENKFSLANSTLETYLLERSRVTLHEAGETNFHIFYLLLEASKSKAYQSLLLSSPEVTQFGGFRYLTPLPSLESPPDLKAYTEEISKRPVDKKDLPDIIKAFTRLGIPNNEVSSIFHLVAAVLHLGNVMFEDVTVDNNDIASPITASGQYSPISDCSKLLGVDSDKLLATLCTSKITARGQVIEKKLDSYRASNARDALAKQIYTSTFALVIKSLESGLTIETESVQDMPWIGILDIFGFETFERNGFEQLLINAANEALQATFNQAIFLNELDLFKKEGLVLKEGFQFELPDNSHSIGLFLGLPTSDNINWKHGLLSVINHETTGLKPSDKKMLANLHRCFNGHGAWGKPHPRHKHRVFIVKHFAGPVKYTLSQFVEKNTDNLSSLLNDLMSVSSVPFFKQGLVDRSNVASSKTIIKSFKQQMTTLISLIESTKVHFIRCIKPNKDMFRGKDKSWFDTGYVSQQLKNLSIPQAAQVLQSGFPTRIEYSAILAKYSSLLPKSPLMNDDNPGLFVRALFWAFQIDEADFKTGLTMIFFRNGKLTEADKVLNSASSMPKPQFDKIKKRFRTYFARLVWRRAYGKVIAANRFVKLLQYVRDKEKERLMRLEKERQEREQEELAAKERELKLAELQKEQEAEKERILDLFVDEKENKAATNLADVYDSIQEEAKNQVKEELGSRANSLNSAAVRELREAKEKELQYEYAEDAAQESFEQKVQNFFAGVEAGWKETMSNIYHWLQPLMHDLTALHEQNMVHMKRSWRVANRLLLKEARKQKWFLDVENRFNEISATLAAEFEKEKQRERGLSKDQSEQMDLTAIQQNTIPRRGMMRTTMRVARDEIKTATRSKMAHIDEVRRLVSSGDLPPSTLNGLLAVIQDATRYDAERKDTQSTISMRYTEVDSFPDVNPSGDDKNRWCQNGLVYDKGLLYISKKVSVTRSRKISLMMGWEHADPAKRGRLFSHWDADLSVASIAGIYDSIRQNAKGKLKSAVRHLPEFPGWNEEAYKALNIQKKKPSMILFGFSGGGSRERARDLRQVLNESVVLRQPGLLIEWLEELLVATHLLLDKTGESALLALPGVSELFDVDTYGGVRNL